MDYKEVFQECYEDLCEELGREPTFKEVDERFRNELYDVCECW